MKLEAALNAYAEEGWEVIATASADIKGLSGGRQELIVILERQHA